MRIHEDPVVVSQPPCVSKPSPIVDTSNRQPLTVDKRTVAKLPPKAPSSCRNGSMPSHFLSEFDVNDCHDVRSIPDPPTPQPRDRRRLSSPMLRASSNPRPGRFPSVAIDSSSKLENETKSSNKRSRKSLCHVPFPSTIEQRDDPSLPSPPSPTNDPKSHHDSICMADEPSEAPQVMDSSSRNKRRKKRQSMELPREIVQEHARSIADDFSPPRAPNLSPNIHAGAGDLHNMRELQRLVRGYCKLPKNQRPTSEEAQSIEATTTYPLTLPILKDHPLSHANRRAVLQKMGPIIEEIDIRKGKDISKWQAGTGCRVERSKSGRYRYYSIASNTKVSSSEYQRRYMDVLSREASDRLAKANDWKARLVPLTDSSESIEPIPFPGHGRGSPSSAMWDTSSDMDEADNSFAVTQELDLDLSAILALNTKPSEDTEAESVPSPAEEGEVNMEICDMSASVDLGEAAIVSVGSELSGSTDSESNAMTGEPLVEKISTDTVPPVDQHEKNTTEKDSSSNVHEEQTECQLEAEETQMLPFPDRESSSTDPDIAKAEEKLWNRIDTALAEYSREVMKIVNSKRVATAQMLGAHSI